MALDAADWVVTHVANLQGRISGKDLGDLAAPLLVPDSVIETVNASAGFGGSGNIVLASFKAAVGSTIAKVGALGRLLVGTATSVSPAFGQAPTAGNLLVAWVSSGSSEPTTAQAGWVKLVSAQSNGQWCAIWYKPNAAGADAAPTFTCSPGSNLMSAQLGEFSGAPTASPSDQTGSTGFSSNPYQVTGGANDAAFGDLVLTVSRVIVNPGGSVSFTDIINNGGVVVQAGSANVAVDGSWVCNDTYTIIPPAATSNPVWVSPVTLPGTAFVSLARGNGTYTFKTPQSPAAKGVKVYINVSAGPGTVTTTIQDVDPAGGIASSALGLVTSPAVGGGSQAILEVTPDLASVANQIQQGVIGGQVVISCVVAGGGATFSVGYAFLS